MDLSYTTENWAGERATFESELSRVSAKKDFISKASLKELKSLIPEGVDFDKNIDLLGVSFNAAVVNVFNKNHDGINTQTALAHFKQFIHKPTNIEHEKNQIIGHIVSAGFSEFGSNKILDESKINPLSYEPINIALGAVVYKSIDKNFSELIERSTDPEDEEYFNTISASWEVGFSEYVLAISNGYTLKDAKIIDDLDEIENMKYALKAYGGSGKTKGGQSIHRLITGDIFPLGIAFTAKPAANVKGLYSNKEKKSVISATNNFSQNLNINVNKEKIQAMDIENTISELKSLLVEKKFSEETVASMTNTFTDAIRQKDDEWKEEVKRVKNEKAAVAAEYDQLKNSVSDLETKLNDANERISEFENAKRAEEAVARFNSRMETIDSEYDLDNDDKLFLAEELKEVGETEEAFASFSKKLSVVWKHKNKEQKERFEAEIQARIDEEVTKRIKQPKDGEKIIEKALDKIEQVDANISNNNQDSTEEDLTLRDKFKKAFSRENIIIS